MEAYIISNLNILKINLSTSVLIKHSIGLVDHVKSTIIELPSNCSQELIKGKLSILIGIEVLDNLSNLNLRKIKPIIPHGIFKFYWTKRSVSISVHCLEHSSEPSQTICTSLLA